MPENNIDKLNLVELWTFIVVIITGAIGGCSAAFANRANEKGIVTAMTTVGYGMAGVFGALIYCASTAFISEAPLSLNYLIVSGLLSGFSTSIALAGVNFGFKIILKRFNFEMEVTIKRIPKSKKKDRNQSD